MPSSRVGRRRIARNKRDPGSGIRDPGSGIRKAAFLIPDPRSACAPGQLPTAAGCACREIAPRSCPAAPAASKSWLVASSVKRNRTGSSNSSAREHVDETRRLESPGRDERPTSYCANRGRAAGLPLLVERLSEAVERRCERWVQKERLREPLSGGRRIG